MIDTEDKWTRLALAEDAEKRSCWDNNPAAVRFSLLGALSRGCSIHGYSQDAHLAVMRVLQVKYMDMKSYDPLRDNKLMQAYNSSLSHPVILAVLDAAIAAA